MKAYFCMHRLTVFLERFTTLNLGSTMLSAESPEWIKNRASPTPESPLCFLTLDPTCMVTASFGSHKKNRFYHRDLFTTLDCTLKLLTKICYSSLKSLL